ncbi:carbon-nitrogen hydrolase family protein [Hoeflea sp. CAU 1731]
MDAELTIAVMQSPGSLGEPEERLNWLEQTLQRHRSGDYDIVALPELFLSGYNVGRKLKERGEPADGPSSRRIADTARRFGLAIHYGYAERAEGGLYSSSQTFTADGALASRHRKLVIPPGFEEDHFVSGAGCVLFEMNGFRIAPLICYDAEFPETFRHVCEIGADLVIVPTALSSQWEVVARNLIPTRALENGVYIAYANHCGEDGDLRFLGHSCIVGPDGRDLARAGRDEEVIAAKLHVGRVAASRKRLPYHVDRKRIRLEGV